MKTKAIVGVAMALPLMAATLAETYANVSGEGTIEVLGLEKGLVVVVR